jgi:hypothetical protein
MKPLPIVVLLAALIAAPIVPQQEDPVRLIGGGKAVELALDGVSVADFLVRAQMLLGVPIHSLPDEVVPARLHQAGEQRVESAAFRDEFDAVLRRGGFWAWDDTSGGAPAIIVRRAPAGRYLGQVPFTPPVITLEELEAGPSKRGPMYTTTFALTHLPARNCLIILMPFLDVANEMVTHVDPSNQLMVTASREHLLAVRDALARMDVPGPQAPGLALNVEELRLQLFELQKRVETLEKKSGG